MEFPWRVNKAQRRRLNRIRFALERARKLNTLTKMANEMGVKRRLLSQILAEFNVSNLPIEQVGLWLTEHGFMTPDAEPYPKNVSTPRRVEYQYVALARGHSTYADVR